MSVIVHVCTLYVWRFFVDQLDSTIIVIENFDSLLVANGNDRKSFQFYKKSRRRKWFVVYWRISRPIEFHQRESFHRLRSQFNENTDGHETKELRITITIAIANENENEKLESLNHHVPLASYAANTVEISNISGHCNERGTWYLDKRQ